MSTASPSVSSSPGAISASASDRGSVFVVPGTHGTVTGWLSDYAVERNYMANNLLAHLDRLAIDPNYTFSLSEVPNIIAIQDMHPERMADLRRYLAEGRIDLSNAFYLNSAVDLTGGEALVRLGIEGIRWQQTVMGIRPRDASLVDTVGLHRQLPQILARLGVRGMVYGRNNPAGQVTHRWQSPDGSTVLAAGVRIYSHWRIMFGAISLLQPESIRVMKEELEAQRLHDADGAPTVLLASGGDYGGPPPVVAQAAHVLAAWATTYPEDNVRFSTLSRYFDELERVAPTLNLRLVTGDAPPSYNGFWSNIPDVKQAFRRGEQLLPAAETLATFASLETPLPYPTAALHDGWINLLLNMDRAILWGVGRGEVFSSPTAWDATDRANGAIAVASAVLDTSLDALGAASPAGLPSSDSLVVFNPLNWPRTDPVRLISPSGRGLDGAVCEAMPASADEITCAPALPSMGYAAFGLGGAAATPASVSLPATVTTPYYRATLDPASGAITSLKTIRDNTELLAGPANQIVAERERFPVAAGDFLAARGQRRWLGSSDDSVPTVTVTQGPVATTVRSVQPFFGGGTLVRTTRFYPTSPRIDFETAIDGIPDDTLVVADFPLAKRILRERRGIPYGMSERDPEDRRPLDPFFMGTEQLRLGFTDAIRPAIRWSAYDLQGGGTVALLDQGTPGREVQGNIVSLHLLNAHEEYRGYPNPSLSGQPMHRFSYGLLVGENGWQALDVPRRAWEFNAPPWSRPSQRPAGTTRSWLETSANVIVESVRREGDQLEVRFVDWTGEGGQANMGLTTPHRSAARTDFLGERAQPLPPAGQYRLQLAPQEIVTLRFQVDSAVEAAAPNLDYRRLAPPTKRSSFDLRHDRRGHPE